jgi:hypothetical protein
MPAHRESGAGIVVCMAFNVANASLAVCAMAISGYQFKTGVANPVQSLVSVLTIRRKAPSHLSVSASDTLYR